MLIPILVTVAVIVLSALGLMALSGWNTQTRGAPPVYGKGGVWYPVKYVLAFILISLRRLQVSTYSRTSRGHPISRDQQDTIGSQHASHSSVPSDVTADEQYGYGKARTDIDGPQPLESDEHALDSAYFACFHRDGTRVVLRAGRRHRRVAEQWIVLTLPGTGTYVSPFHPDTVTVNNPEAQFTAGDLSLSVVKENVRWRLSYNGVLRQVRDGEGTLLEDCSTLKHVKFVFIWTALSGIFHFERDLPTGAVARALSQETWTREFFRRLRSSHQTHYEQVGELHGEIAVEGHTTKVITARGFRDRSYGVRHWSSFHRYVTHFMTLDCGIAFQLTLVSLPVSLSYLPCGYLMRPNGETFPITATSLKLWELDEDEENKTKEYSFTFCAVGHTYSVSVTKTDVFTFHHGSDRHNIIYENMAEVTLDGKPGRGIIEYNYRHAGVSEQEETTSKNLLKAPQLRSTKCESVLAVNLSESADHSYQEAVGGKAVQLSLLTSIAVNEEFTVPKAVCLTAAAFKLHLSGSPSLMEKVDSLQTIQLNTLKEQCARVCAGVISMEIPLSVCSTLQKLLVEAFGDGFEKEQFAVRSSAVGEDGVEASSAGQMDTLLGVMTFPSILSAVKQCWSSCFSFLAVNYNRQLGQLVNPGMGVIVQRMVPAQAAGVLFTRDPLTGNPSLMSISANYGLGESVVSGAVEPDTIEVCRSWDEELSIHKKEIGSKAKSHILNKDGSSVVDTEPASRTVCCLTNAQILSLCRIGIQLEKHFGTSRDVEWAVCGDDIHLLQARPITTFDLPSEYEIEHEFDDALTKDNEILTRSNIGEVYPGKISTLGIDQQVHGCLGVAMNKLLSETGGLPFVPSRPAFMKVFRSYAYLDIEEMETANVHRNSIGRRRIMELSLVGEAIEQLTNERVLEYHGSFSFLKRWKLGVNMVWSLLLAVRRMKSVEKAVVSADGGMEEDNGTARDLYHRISNFIPFCTDVILRGLWTSAVSGSTAMILIGIVTQGKEVWTVEHFRDMASLLSECSNLISCDIPNAMKALAKVLRSSEGCSEFLTMSEQEGADWLLGPCSEEVGEAFRSFLKKHGHRCINELALMVKGWDQDCRPLVSSLQKMVGVSSSVKGHGASENETVRPKVSDDEIIADLSTPLSSMEKRVLKFVLPWAKKGVETREWGKGLQVKVSDTLRKGYWKLGDYMENEGYLPDGQLVFFLTHAEIGEVLDHRSPRLVLRAVRRKRMFETPKQIDSTTIIHGRPVLRSEEEASNGQLSGYDEDADVFVKGMPISLGEVTGTARVLTALDGAQEIQKGDILIVPFTDVGWSPYFPLLSGLVTEIGGLVSHGAVVAREFALPCVVGCQGATRKFRTGDTVKIVASTGMVYRLDRHHGDHHTAQMDLSTD